MLWMQQISELNKEADNVFGQMTKMLSDISSQMGRDVTESEVTTEIVQLREKKPAVNPQLSQHVQQWLAEAGMESKKERDFGFKEADTVGETVEFVEEVVTKVETTTTETTTETDKVTITEVKPTEVKPAAEDKPVE